MTEQEKALKEAADHKKHYLETHSKEELYDRIEQLIMNQRPNKGPYVVDPKFAIQGEKERITLIRRSGGRAQIWIDYGNSKKPIVLDIDCSHKFDELIAFLESKEEPWKRHYDP